jgi:hypothetical protein
MLTPGFRSSRGQKSFSKMALYAREQRNLAGDAGGDEVEFYMLICRVSPQTILNLCANVPGTKTLPKGLTHNL